MDGKFTMMKQSNFEGAFWKIIACVGFAGMNSIVRYMTGGTGCCGHPLSPDVLTFFQNVFAFLIMFPFIARQGFGALKTKQPLLHSIRILMAVTGIITLYTAFAKMPMAKVVALQFTGPVFTVIAAKFYLKEHIGPYRSLGIFAGLFGAFIITRPDQALFGDATNWDWALLLPLVSAIAFVVVKVIGRELGIKGESPQLLTIYLLFFMIPAAGVPAAWTWVVPDMDQYPWLVLLGLCGVVAHYATARAYCLAEVTYLTPFGFARIIITTILGYVIFDEFPKEQSLWYGFLFITLSTVFMVIGDAKSNTKYATA